MKKEFIPIILSAQKEGGKWVIRLSNVSSGVRIHGCDGDSLSIEFDLDASRFTPDLIVESDRS
jgi:hypothetical protein